MPQVQFIHYPKCSTCRNAKKYIESKGFQVQERHIVDEPLNKQELRDLIAKSGLDIRKWFNTSGQKYRELGLKDKIGSMSEDELITLLVSDGMLVKRPVIRYGDRVTVGFKQEAVDQVLQA
ncbi:arsenate reductase family protein [Effusibacillus dendaii]|uniref:Arsenate reductase n=1 Tax=Effusibacillus dendaii TaxID=2743772 RepID=A0A7I8DC35_9BACL|nr:arsenate reductase family protein [Effusibacillus dendaii]BCJ86539.1 hypothetical protein skT53_15240 [Effusibacillus dendaii]